jgi:hypothetical protein
VQHFAPWRLDNLVAEGSISDINGHSIRDFIIGNTDSEDSNPVSNELINVFKEIQLYLELTGIHWELTGIRIKAIEDITKYDDAMQECYEHLVLSKDVSTDWDYEEFGGCQKLQT